MATQGASKTTCRAAYEKFGEGCFNAETQRRRVDVPFDLPQGWAWARLESILKSLHTGLNPRRFFKLNTPDAQNYYVTIRELKNNTIVVSDKTDRINDMALQLCNNRSDLEEGDVLFGGTGTIGVCALVSEHPSNWNIKEGIYALKPFQSSLLSKYLLCLLQSEPIRKSYLSKAVGATVLSVPMKELVSMIMPLPPLAEQKRIVAKIEELFSLADLLGAAADGLENAAKRLDKKILDLAIRGRLVPQDPNDEPASELVKRIAASHKSPCKNQSEPIDPPFEIPGSWKWVRLGLLVQVISGVSYSKSAITESGIRILRGGNLNENAELTFYDDDVFISSNYYDNDNEIRRGDIVIVASTGSSKVIGRPAIATHDMSGVQIGAFLRIVRTQNLELSKWIATLFCSRYYRTYIRKISKGTNIKNLKAEYITGFAIPLPPLAEQKKIVAKIEELRAVIKSLTM